MTRSSDRHPRIRWVLVALTTVAPIVSCSDDTATVAASTTAGQVVTTVSATVRTTTGPTTTVGSLPDEVLTAALLRPTDFDGAWRPGWAPGVVSGDDITVSILAWRALCDLDGDAYLTTNRIAWRVATSLNRLEDGAGQVAVVQAMATGDSAVLVETLTTLRRFYRRCLQVIPREDGWIVEVHGPGPDFGIVGVAGAGAITIDGVQTWSIFTNEFRIIGSVVMVVAVMEQYSAPAGCRPPERLSVGSCRLAQREVAQLVETARAKVERSI